MNTNNLNIFFILPIFVTLFLGLLSYLLFVDLFHGFLFLVLKGIQHTLGVFFRHLLTLLLLLLLLLLVLTLLVLLLLLLLLLVLLLLLLFLLPLVLLLVFAFILLEDG